MTNQAPRTRDDMVWFGALVSVVGLVGYFFVSAGFPSLRDTAWLNLLIVACGFALSIAAVRRRRSVASVAGAVLSFLCAALLVGYVFVLSEQLPDAEGVIAIAAEAPDFSLTDHTGATVSLEHVIGKPLVLVFYRGFW